MLWIFFYVALLSTSQTTYQYLPSENFFNLTISYDGRIEAKIRGGDYYGEGDPYREVYRNFIELNRDTGRLMIAFAVAEFDFIDEAHIMTVTIPSGATVTGPPLNATFPKPHWFNDNMILWYDQKLNAQVLLFQEGCYSCLADYGYDDWMTNHDYNALNQSIYKTISFDDGITWHGKVELLRGKVLDPHVQFQIIPSLKTDEDGFSTQVMIPIHHLDEDSEDDSYQMLWRADRAMDPNDGSWSVVNMTDDKSTEHFGAHIQASIVRPSGDAKLVAFLRDRYGHWVHRTTSADDGRTWTTQLPTSLGNPDLMSQAIALHNGHVMLFHNPQQSYGSWPAGDRDDNSHMLAVSISENAGLSWIHQRILEYANDGKSLYPVALQDPLCDNIYLSWSVEVNEQGPKLNCLAIINNGGSVDDYFLCIDRSVTMAFIKFSVIHENWVLDNHNWSLDYEGCTWQIARSLQDQIEEMKDSYTEGASKHGFLMNLYVAISSSSGRNYSGYILALVVALSGLICLSAAILYYNYRKRGRSLIKLSLAPL